MAAMMIGLEAEDKFHAGLFEIDVAAAEAVRAGRCSRPGCGGRLDFANYPRKVRGLDEGAALAGRYDSRLSLCCSVRGCRRRATPPSVRFLGRFVYAMRVLVAWAASRLAPSRLSSPTSAPSRQTTKRWGVYWGEVGQDARMALLVGALVVSSGAAAANLVVAVRSGHGDRAHADRAPSARAADDGDGPPRTSTMGDGQMRSRRGRSWSSDRLDF